MPCAPRGNSHGHNAMVRWSGTWHRKGKQQAQTMGTSTWLGLTHQCEGGTLIQLGQLVSKSRSCIDWQGGWGNADASGWFLSRPPSGWWAVRPAVQSGSEQLHHHLRRNCRVSLLNRVIFEGVTIGMVVVQWDITHNKILSWMSLILCTYHLFYHFRNRIYALQTYFKSWFKG